MSYFYKHHELSLRLGFFWTASALADVLGAFLAFGLLHLRGLDGRAGWRWLFLFEVGEQQLSIEVTRIRGRFFEYDLIPERVSRTEMSYSIQNCCKIQRGLGPFWKARSYNKIGHEFRTTEMVHCVENFEKVITIV